MISNVRHVASLLPWSRYRKNWRNAKLYCSFCAKSEDEVGKLVAGPSVFICDDCVGLCSKIMREADATQAQKFAGVDAMSTERLLHWLKIQQALFDHARAAMQDAVDTLRQREVSWATIGEALGVSRQAAWDRFS